jgi:hypothetical protein
MIEHITQVVIELSKNGDKSFLKVRKAFGRYDPRTYQSREYVAKETEIDVL